MSSSLEESYTELSTQPTIFEEINPGNTLRGVIVFDVPNGAEIVRAEMHDWAFSGGVSVSLN